MWLSVTNTGLHCNASNIFYGCNYNSVVGKLKSANTWFMNNSVVINQ